MPKDYLNVNKDYRNEIKELYKGKKGWKYIIHIYIIWIITKGWPGH